jgi:o-succinylbenzoate---CoA ligase
MKLFEKIQSHSPFSTALISSTESLTYGELAERVSCAVDYLNQFRIKEQQFIAVYSANSIQFIITILALWQMKAVPLLINRRLLQQEADEIINFSKSIFIISDSEINLPGGVKNILMNDISFHRSNAKYSISSNEEDTAVVIFTSGSTGKPKGVMLSFKSLFNSVESGNKILNQTKEDVWLASLPFYHIGGFSIFLRAFYYGASVVIPDSLKIPDIVQAIKNYSPTLISLVSTQLKRLIENEVEPPANLKFSLIGGGYISPIIIKEAISKKWKPVIVYGSTETSSFITALHYNEFERKQKSCGKPVDKNEIVIFNEEKQILGKNETGEIGVKSGSLMNEYLYESEKSKNKFHKEFYLTGDNGFLDEDGYLYVNSRRTDLIISGGENIDPLEIEIALLKHKHINDAAVIPIEDDEWGQIPAAVISLNKEIIEQDIVNFLKDILPSFKIPKKFFIMETLPRNELGKLMREEINKFIHKFKIAKPS